MFGHTPSKENAPLIALEVAQIAPDAPDVDVETASMVLRSELLPTVASIRPIGIALYNEEEDQSISLSYFKHPELKFTQSGQPLVSLSWDDKDGVRFAIRAPLGIKGAWEEVTENFLEGRKTDPRIEEAFGRSLRFDLGTPPFADPYLRLWKDGRLVSQLGGR